MSQTHLQFRVRAPDSRPRHDDDSRGCGLFVDGLLFDNWSDPIETACGARAELHRRTHPRQLTAALDRPRYGRRGVEGRPSALVAIVIEAGRDSDGTFRTTKITVPRARIEGENGTTTEWKSKALRAYQRRTLAADVLIASAYLAPTRDASAAR